MLCCVNRLCDKVLSCCEGVVGFGVSGIGIYCL